MGKGRAKQDLGTNTSNWNETLKTEMETGLSKMEESQEGEGFSLWSIVDSLLHSQAYPTHCPTYVSSVLPLLRGNPSQSKAPTRVTAELYARVGPGTAGHWPSPSAQTS